jgi:hypothetical protein
MIDRTTTETTIRPLPHSTLLLFGVFAAPAAWAIQLVTSYALAASSCFSGGVAKIGDPSVSRAPMAIVTLACVLLATAGLVIAMKQHRDVGDTTGTRHPTRSRALAKVGILSSILFLGAIAFSIVMLTMSPHCAG